MMLKSHQEAVAVKTLPLLSRFNEASAALLKINLAGDQRDPFDIKASRDYAQATR